MLLVLVPLLILLTALNTAPILYAQNATSQNATSQNATSQNATSQNATSQNATEPALIAIPVPVPAPVLITDIIFVPPPGYGAVRELPSYAVRIPFSDDGRSSFEPATIAIPADMTVIWFNDDQNPHTVTMNASSSTVSSGTSFDSDIIPPMGHFIQQFSQPGTYEYYDSINPSAKGRVSIGSEYEKGTNIDMLAGGDILPFNASKLERLTVSFVPHENVTTLPPTTGDIIYNVTIANSTGTLYSNQFVDSDGILDLEFVPITQTEHFVNWGPDTGDITSKQRNDGTFHIQGPVLVDNDLYQIEVSIIEKDGAILQSPISDTFVLHSVGSQ